MNVMDQDSLINDQTDAAIRLTGVSMAFEARRVLDRINLSVYAGQALCLCGVNGAGKSTLMRIINGLLQPTSGSVHVHGFSMQRQAQAAKPLVGVISHMSMLYPDLTVEENLQFAAQLYGVKESKHRAIELLESIGLAGYRYDRTGILSRGMLQRLAICRALVHHPRVLLADEPFTGLDILSCQSLVATLEAFRREGGTILLTTHETRYGITCCDRVVVLDEAKLIFDAPTDAIDSERFITDYLNYAKESV